MYASVADLRAEGVTAATATDERLTSLLEEATRCIDRVTGWFFELRTMTVRLDGRGAPSLDLPVPVIQLTRMIVCGTEWPLGPDDLVIVGAPVATATDGPRITLTGCRRFPMGRGNVILEGTWGLVEDDGTALGRTPVAIRRACMLLVLRWLSPLNDGASLDGRSAWRVLEERTRDQSYKLAPLETAGRTMSGDPEIDSILELYARPSHLGAA